MNDSPFAAPHEVTNDTVRLERRVPDGDGAPAPSIPIQPAAQPLPDIEWPATVATTEVPAPRMRRSTVALIAAGALVLGAAGGVGGAAIYDSTQSPAVSTLPGANEAIGAPAEGSIAAIAAAALPSVVSIESTSAQGTATGSGFIVRADGYIATNNHVVEGATDGTVRVLMSDGDVVTGTVVGTAPEYDIAVVKIDRTNLAPLALGDSDKVVVGNPVIAVGSPLGLDSTVTAGIISALHRPVTAGGADAPAFIDAIQTDAAINPGNSGGPLINSGGEVIGINSAIAALPGTTRASGAGSVGLGFAIPSNQVRTTVDQLITDGVATFPVVGVLLDQSYTGKGVRIAEEVNGQPGVVPGGPADVAGLQPLDVIVAFDGRPVARADELVVAIRAQAPGDTVTLTVERGSETLDVDVTLAADSAVDFGNQP